MPRHFHKTMMNPHFSHDNHKNSVGGQMEAKIESWFKRLLFWRERR